MKRFILEKRCISEIPKENVHYKKFPSKCTGLGTNTGSSFASKVLFIYSIITASYQYSRLVLELRCKSTSKYYSVHNAALTRGSHW